MNLAKFGSGMIAGLVIGSVMGMAIKQNTRKSSNMKRNVGKTLRTLGNMVDNYR